MSEPLVCAVMLTKDRPEMAARAVRAFREQTYQNKRLLIWDTGELNQCFDTMEETDPEYIVHVPAPAYREITIGALRNEAVRFWNDYDIVIHWDDDDWSHPNRIAEQVAHLQSSGADVVGYNELLFWRSPLPGPAPLEIKQSFPPLPPAPSAPGNSQAWLWKAGNPLITPCGTSLCYWRAAWERNPFPDTSHAEDRLFCERLNWRAMSSIIGWEPEPRLIASIHGGNTAGYDLEGILARGGGTSWRRAVEWDKYARERMAL